MFKKKGGDDGKLALKNVGERVKTNEGLYDQLVKDVRYVVIGKNGSAIPCIPVGVFSVIHPAMPDELIKIRRVQAHTLTGKLDDNAWRLSHGNDMGHLPEFVMKDKVFANARDDSRSAEDHKMQQFQEYDVSRMLKDKGSKEVSDLGAMRVIVDECFEHVYFTIEHYRPTIVGKVTKSQKDGKQDIAAFNPYIFVLFEPPPPQEIKSLTKIRKKEPVMSATDQLFKTTNITEVKQGNKAVTATFKGQNVTIINPAVQRRGRANSFQMPVVPTPQPIIVSTLDELATAAELPRGAVEHAAMTLGLSPTKVPEPNDWDRILAFVKVHYGVVGTGTLH